MKNVTISPHSSDFTSRTEDRAAALFLDNLGRYLAGEPLRNVVDLARGY